MSGENQDKLKLSLAAVQETAKRLVGTRKRMETIGSVISLRKGKDADELLTKSKQRIEQAINMFEAEAKTQGVSHKPMTREIVAGMAKIYNILDSATDGIESQDLTKEDLTQAGDEVVKLTKAVRSLMHANIIDAAKAKVDPADEFLAANANPESTVEAAIGEDGKTNEERWRHQKQPRSLTEDEQQKDKHSKDHYEGIKNLFDSNKVHLTKLPDAKTSKEEFIIRKLPVIPQMNKPVSDQQFKDAGFKIGGKAGFYVQINDQLLLGVNTQSVKEMKMKLHKYVQNIVAVISQQKRTVFHVVGSDDHDLDGSGRKTSHSPGFVYYWLLSDQDLNKLNKVLERSGNTFSVDDWGLSL